MASTARSRWGRCVRRALDADHHP